MTSKSSDPWSVANQRYLMARIGLVRGALTRQAGTSEQPQSPPLESILAEAAEALPAPAALDSLCLAFGLSPFERDLLLLCAGVELDSNFARLCASAQGNPQRPFPTFSLALAVLPEPHWSALTPAAPLRRWRLLEVGAGEALTISPLRIDERVLHHLAGLSHLDIRLQGLIEPVLPVAELAPSQLEVARRIAALWNHAQPFARQPVIQLCGEASGGQLAVAAHACAAAGLRLHRLGAADVPPSAAERDALARLWEREAALSNSALLLDSIEPEQRRVVLAFLENVKGIVLVEHGEPLRHPRRIIMPLDVARPTAAEQCALWRLYLVDAAPRLNGELEGLVQQFNLDPEAIEAISALVVAEKMGTSPGDCAGRLWQACRAQARQRLDALAQRIEPVADWPDLVLPEPQLQTLREIALQVRHRAQVYERWGFSRKGKRGLGISALFAGPSGTGKTMAAEVLANELRLDLYRIDLSQVVSKYIGETEKNLRRVFDAAQEGGAILLFDEADALFGKRSEVKDSHDRYANIEISYLLQRMEAYRGLAILTTNMKGALDTAFMRRLRFVVRFLFPDAAQRAKIWRTIFPDQTPTENLNPARLARLNVAGGNIRNIALHAAFLAADADEPVRMDHLIQAARHEYSKLEKPLTESEISGWL
jgi:hypothetical protein